VSPLRRWVVRLALAGAVLGPAGGAAALWFGNLALWGADVPAELPDVVTAGIYLGTFPTVACAGLLLASPFRLFAALGLQRDAWWGWPLIALCAVVGLADLSLGFVHTVLILWLWGREGPSSQGSPPNAHAGPPGDPAGDNSAAQPAP
jgi:hypothetical protein